MSTIERCWLCHTVTRTLPMYGHRMCVCCILGHARPAA